jgi:hypothetical protein
MLQVAVYFLYFKNNSSIELYSKNCKCIVQQLIAQVLVDHFNYVKKGTNLLKHSPVEIKNYFKKRRHLK